MACILKRKSVIAVSFIAAFLFLLVVRLVNEVNFPLLLNCFGQPGAKWIPFSYTYRRPLRTHYGYINVRTQEPLQLDCNLCAIVSNSGQMVGQKVGNEIDQSSCIWRMNNAPTKGYEEDVGRMTMIRVVSHTSVPLLLKNPDYFFKEANTTIYVIWGPFRNMRKDGNGIVYNMLKKTVDIYPNAQIYVTTEKRMSYCDGVFKKETGKDSQQQPSPWVCSTIPKLQLPATEPSRGPASLSRMGYFLLQLCLTLCDPKDCSPPGSSVHGILQARILGWVAISFSRRSSDPGIKPTSLLSPALAGISSSRGRKEVARVKNGVGLINEVVTQQ